MKPGIIALIVIALMMLWAIYTQDIAHPQELTASWYSEESCRREGTSGRCADGSIFRDENKTAASWDHTFGTKLKVTCLTTGKSVIVEIRDRGPNKKLYKRGRVLDLSKSSFAEIADLKVGVIPIRYEVVE